MVFEPLSKGRRKQGCQEIMANPGERSSEGHRLESHTKTLMERASSRNQLSPLPKIGEGFRKWFEAPSYEEGVGVDGGF